MIGYYTGLLVGGATAAAFGWGSVLGLAIGVTFLGLCALAVRLSAVEGR